MMIEYTVRTACLSDADAISQIENACFSHPWSRNLIELEIENSSAVFLVAEDEDMLLGYVSGQHVVDEFYVSNLAVREECRGLGIGSMLMGQLIDTAKELACAFITLEVRVSNEKARSLYESLGFRALGERKDYYDDPRENAVIYTLYFDNAEMTDEHSCD
jgi:ribosomal-protein-alanine N-acetyltransferase